MTKSKNQRVEKRSETVKTVINTTDQRKTRLESEAWEAYAQFVRKMNKTSEADIRMASVGD